MNKQLAAIVLGAAVFLVAGIIGATRLTGSDSSPTAGIRTMQDGSAMPSGMTTTMEPTHTMDDGEMMRGMDHGRP
jgi:hypothetical protein